MSEQDPSLNHTAASVVGIVKDHPGIHFRELARAAQITSMGQLRHHVDRLRQRGVLVEVQDGRYKRFFVSGSHPPNVRRTLTRFSRPVPQRIAKLLLWRPMTRSELRRNLGCADSTLGYHLSRMSLHGDVVKTSNDNRARYTLSDPQTVREALVVQDKRPTAPSGDGAAVTNEPPGPGARPTLAADTPAQVGAPQTERAPAAPTQRHASSSDPRPDHRPGPSMYGRRTGRRVATPGLVRLEDPSIAEAD